MSEEKLKIAVVGLGKMGILHSCILNVLPHIELSALCEKSSMTRSLLKKVFNGVRMVDDVRKLADLGLDAVYVTTPIPSHYPVVKTLYSMNVARNVFVEKTLAVSYDEAKELCELANQSGGVNMVGYLRRFYVTFRKAKDMLSEDVIGKLSSFRAYAYSSDFLGADEAGTSASRGGVLRDLGCHAVDLALWFFGDLRVRSANSASCVGPNLDGSVNFEVENSGGLKGDFSVSWRMENYRMPEAGLSITGSEGTLMVNDDKIELNLKDGRKSTMYRHDLDDNVPFWLALPEYYREDLCFVKSIEERVKVELDFRAGSKVDEIISKVEKRVGASGQQ